MNTRMSVTEARARAGQAMGLAGFGGSIAEYQALSAAQQVDLDNAVASFITANPSYFTPEQVSIAGYRTAHPQSAVQDTSINWGDFGNAVVDNASSLATGFTSSLGKTFMLAVFVALLAGTSSLWLPSLRAAVTKK